MKIRIVKKGKEKWQFSLEEASMAFANGLRRVMVSEVPTLAIDWLEIHENTSSVFDEMVGQRLGLLPLTFTPDKFNFQADCACAGKGCPSCQVVFALEREGPGVVTSKDLKSSNKDVRPTDPGFILLEILENQKIKLEAVARLGTAKEHAKFQAATVTFQNVPEMKGEEVNTEADKFLFSVESISGLSPDYVISKAAEILEGKAREFKKEAADI